MSVIDELGNCLHREIFEGEARIFHFLKNPEGLRLISVLKLHYLIDEMEFGSIHYDAFRVADCDDELSLGFRQKELRSIRMIQMDVLCASLVVEGCIEELGNGTFTLQTF